MIPNMMVCGRESSLPVALTYDIVPHQVPRCPLDCVDNIRVQHSLNVANSFALDCKIDSSTFAC